MRKNEINPNLTRILSILLMLLSLSVSAQEVNFPEEPDEDRNYKVRPVRLGVKIGIPNLVGGNLEYVTPLLNDRLSISLDYSTIKSDWFMSEEDNVDDTRTEELNFSYLEGDLNYYFFKAGKGLYAGVGYGRINIKGETVVTNNGEEGTGSIDFSHSSLHVKLGAKLGGLFYFRPEVGYSFTSIPKTINYQVQYPDGRTEKDVYDFTEQVASADYLFQGLIANIGFGFAF